MYLNKSSVQYLARANLLEGANSCHPLLLFPSHTHESTQTKISGDGLVQLAPLHGIWDGYIQDNRCKQLSKTSTGLISRNLHDFQQDCPSFSLRTPRNTLRIALRTPENMSEVSVWLDYPGKPVLIWPRDLGICGMEIGQKIDFSPTVHCFCLSSEGDCHLPLCSCEMEKNRWNLTDELASLRHD